MPARTPSLDEIIRILEADRQLRRDNEAEARLRANVRASAEREAARIFQETRRINAERSAQIALRQRQHDEEMRDRAECDPSLDPEERDAPVVVAVAAPQFANLPVAVICQNRRVFAEYARRLRIEEEAGIESPETIAIYSRRNAEGIAFSRIETFGPRRSNQAELEAACKLCLPVATETPSTPVNPYESHVIDIGGVSHRIVGLR